MKDTNYFDLLEKEIKKAYDVALSARSKGFDPSNEVEIFLAKNMAEKVEGLVSAVVPQIIGSGMPERISELETQFGKLDWRVAFSISLEVAQGKFCSFKDTREGIEAGIRVGLSYITLGVIAAPLDGFVKLELKDRQDGKKYMCLYYSGPIRSAGGTGASVSVLIAEYLRKKFEFASYDPNEKEIRRAITEVNDYHDRVTNLQYLPSEEELEFLVSHLTVQIDGDPSEKFEVSNYKDLPRIGTNRIRNGFCLVVAECLCQKAPKLYSQLSKWKNTEYGLEDWDFLEKFVKLQKKMKAKEKVGSTEDTSKIKPDFTFIKDLVAGRPILTHPMHKGGFRLRYGRARNSGLSSTCIHPATMVVLNDFIAIGTQLKLERPGKGTALGVSDTIEGPIVKLKNGDVMFLDTEQEARKNLSEVKEILFLGDLLVSYGDFLNRAHVLVPSGYCEEWWRLELNDKVSLEYIKENLLIEVDKVYNNNSVLFLDFEKTFKISKEFGISLYPRYTYHFCDISILDLTELINWVSGAKIIKDGEFDIILPYGEDKLAQKRAIEILGIPHKNVLGENIVISGDFAKGLAVSLGFYENEFDLEKILTKIKDISDPLEAINKISELKVRDKSGTYIGGRMGRPEKAKLRKLTGSPHALFPVGEEGGRLRSFQSAFDGGKIKGDFPTYFCLNCNRNTIYKQCHICNNQAKQMFFCLKCNKDYETNICKLHGELLPYSNYEINIIEYIENAKKLLGLSEIPDLVKGVRGTSNKDHIPEHLAKGVLRAMHNLCVNKDGTIRYDMTELAITHFRPLDIGTSIKKLKELGYILDIFGKDIISDDQLLELNVQDLILPACQESPEEGSDIILMRSANFIDGLLEGLYGVKKFYNVKKKEDLIGHLLIGIAPHTSAGIVSRVIGFSNTQGCLAHPMWHCAIRRDCDGDECAIMLLLDGFINFSRKFLSAHRGSTQDAPIVLTKKLIPSEVDDMVFDMDIVDHYPLSFYQAALDYKMPYEIKIERVGSRLGKEDQYSGFGFTHDTSNINIGVRRSAYKSIPTMIEKVRGQMELAEKIRAVDTSDVARLIIERHFIRDIKGNLRKFSTQQFRCSKCNEKYRRPPLMGMCLKCGGKLIFTVSQGSIIKYLQPSLELASKYDLPSYLKQTLELTKSRIDSLFGVNPEMQEGLVRWF